MGNLIQSKRRGVALFLTLSVMLMITVVVIETVQSTSTEIKLIENEESRFQLEIFATSVLTAFIEGIRLEGANRVYLGLSLLEDAVPITDDVIAQNIRIWSMDHFIPINTSFSGSTGKLPIQLISNALDIQPGGIDDKASYYPYLLGSIADFKDSDQNDFFDNFLVGSESYVDANPQFTVKNADFDFVTELNLLPSFQTLKLIKQTKDIYHLPFRFKNKNILNTPIDCKIGPLNLNMTPIGKPEKFREYMGAYLSLMKDIDSNPNYDCLGAYAVFHSKSGELIDATLDNFSGSVIPRPFSIPLSTDSRWKGVLNSLNVQDVQTKDDGLFSARSNLIGLTFQVQTRGLVKTVIANLELEYKDNKSAVPMKIKIVYFKTF